MKPNSNPSKREKGRLKSNSEIEEMGEEETSGFLEEEELSGNFDLIIFLSELSHFRSRCSLKF